MKVRDTLNIKLVNREMQDSQKFRALRAGLRAPCMYAHFRDTIIRKARSINADKDNKYLMIYKDMWLKQETALKSFEKNLGYINRLESTYNSKAFATN